MDNPQEDRDLTLSERQSTPDLDCDISPADISQGQSEPPAGLPHLDLTPDSSGEENFPPRQLRYYSRVRFLGRGGNGVVWLYRHDHLKQWRAIKFSPGNRRDVRGKPLSSLLKEAQAMAKLQHPNIAAVTDYDPSSELEYIVMEYIEGHNFGAILKQGKVENATVVRVLEDLAKALSFLREHRLVHRDIKPSNVMKEIPSITYPSGRIVLIDFGTTCPNGSASTRGSWPYMAPELWNHQPIDWRTDQYALGLTTATLLGANVLRFQRREEYARFHTEGDTPVLPDLGDSVPPRMKTLLNRMTQRKPEDRYQSPQDILEEVQQLLNQTTASVGLSVPVVINLVRPVSPQLTHSLSRNPTTHVHQHRPQVAQRWIRAALWMILFFGGVSDHRFSHPDVPHDPNIVDNFTRTLNVTIDQLWPYYGVPGDRNVEQPRFVVTRDKTHPEAEPGAPTSVPSQPSSGTPVNEENPDVMKNSPPPSPSELQPPVDQEQVTEYPESEDYQPDLIPPSRIVRASSTTKSPQTTYLTWDTSSGDNNGVVDQASAETSSNSGDDVGDVSDDIIVEEAPLELDSDFDLLVDQAISLSLQTNTRVVLTLRPGNYDCYWEHEMPGGADIILRSTSARNLVSVTAKGEHRFFSLQPGASLELDGIGLSGGNAINGGAIYLNGGYLLARRSRFTDNTSRDAMELSRGFDMEGGGAIFGRDQSLVELKACQFERNSSGADGGALYLSRNSQLYINDSNFIGNFVKRGQPAGSSEPWAADTLPSENVLVPIHQRWEDDNMARVQDSVLDPLIETGVESKNTGMGGAIYIYESSMTLEGSTFSHNAGANGGAIAIVESEVGDLEIVIETVHFEHNYALRHGGALAIWNSRVQIHHSVLNRNRALAAGGAIRINAADVLLSNTYLGDNYATVGGGISLYRSVHFTALHAWMSGNIAAEGGAMRIYASHFDIVNSLLDYNTADKAGGAIFVRGVVGPVGDRRITNSILTRNGVLGEGRIGGLGLDSADVTIINSVLSQNSDWDLYALRAEPTLYTSAISDVLDEIPVMPCPVDVDEAPQAEWRGTGTQAGEEKRANFEGAGTSSDGNTRPCPVVSQSNIEHADTDLGFTKEIDFCRLNSYHLLSDSMLLDAGSSLASVIDIEHSPATMIVDSFENIEWSAATTDMDGSDIDVGLFGGAQGALWDLDGDGYFNWPWPGHYHDVPEYYRDTWRNYDRDDCDPGRH